MLPLLMALTADAAVLHATVRVDGADLTVVHAIIEDGDLPSTPGDLAIIDANGEVLATAAMPPLMQFRAVSTPEGHEVGRHPSPYLRIAVPWPEGAARLRAAGRDIEPRAFPSGQLPPPGVEAAVSSGDISRRMDLVILSEGYPAGQEARFRADVAEVVQHLHTLEPWNTYWHLLNVWQAFVPSTDVGIDQDETPGSTGSFNTPFECHYGCDNIDRLICCDEPTIIERVDELAPFADGILLLVNERQHYGGSGGLVYSTAYVGPDGPRVAAHELAHTLVLLWDEYPYGIEGDADRFISPNCAPEGETPPWQAWMDAEHPDIGSYPNCSFSNWVRPTPSSCMMNMLQNQYCPICREHIVRELYRMLGHTFTTSISPPANEPIRLKEGESQTFSVAALEPTHGLTWEWSFDGELLATGQESFTLDGCGNRDGELMLTLRDDTEWVRNDPYVLLTDAIRWPVRTERCAGDPASSCGCNGTGSAPAALLLPLLLLRRRRSCSA